MPRGGRRAPKVQPELRSHFEDRVAADLRTRGVPFEYEQDRLAYETAHVYVTDFTLANGIIVETKGWFTAADRRKMLDVRERHPERDIRLLFQRAATKLGRGPRSLTYGQWADRNEFLWAEGIVPEHWILEGK